VNFLIFGAGAIGGLVGGRLALGGHTVTLLARPTVAEAVRAHGLRLVSGGGEQVATPARAVTSLAEAFTGPLDCVILSVKSYSTAEAIQQIAQTAPQPPPILCLQNGVDNEAALAEAFGADRVISGIITTTVTVDRPGTVVVQRERGMGVAARTGAEQALAGALAGAGLQARTYADAAAMKWSKMLVNIMGNATSAICDVGTTEVFDNAGLYHLEIEALRECLAVMRARKIGAVNLPRTPTAWLALGLRTLPSLALQGPLRYLLKDARAGRAPSFHADLMRGTGQSEVGWLNGSVVRHGREAGVPTPVNSLLTETLEGILAGRIAWDDYRGKPEKLAAALGA
jgi:2-dehydropantoate 2-reductase